MEGLSLKDLLLQSDARKDSVTGSREANSCRKEPDRKTTLQQPHCVELPSLGDLLLSVEGRCHAGNHKKSTRAPAVIPTAQQRTSDELASAGRQQSRPEQPNYVQNGAHGPMMGMPPQAGMPQFMMMPQGVQRVDLLGNGMKGMVMASPQAMQPVQGPQPQRDTSKAAAPPQPQQMAQPQELFPVAMLQTGIHPTQGVAQPPPVTGQCSAQVIQQGGYQYILMEVPQQPTLQPQMMMPYALQPPMAMVGVGNPMMMASASSPYVPMAALAPTQNVMTHPKLTPTQISKTRYQCAQAPGGNKSRKDPPLVQAPRTEGGQPSSELSLSELLQAITENPPHVPLSATQRHTPHEVSSSLINPEGASLEVSSSGTARSKGKEETFKKEVTVREVAHLPKSSGEVARPVIQSQNFHSTTDLIPPKKKVAPSEHAKKVLDASSLSLSELQKEVGVNEVVCSKPGAAARKTQEGPPFVQVIQREKAIIQPERSNPLQTENAHRSANLLPPKKKVVLPEEAKKILGVSSVPSAKQAKKVSDGSSLSLVELQKEVGIRDVVCSRARSTTARAPREWGDIERLQAENDLLRAQLEQPRAASSRHSKRVTSPQKMDIDNDDPETFPTLLESWVPTNLVILDTSYLLDFGVSTFCTTDTSDVVTFVLPWAVLHELDFQSKTSDEHKRRMITMIRDYVRLHPRSVHVQPRGKEHCPRVTETARCNDDHILSCAVFFHENRVGCSVKIFTSDRILALKAQAEGLIVKEHVK